MKTKDNVIAESRTLAELVPGDTAIIETFKEVGPNVRRIMTLGINAGATVKMVRRAPLPREHPIHTTKEVKMQLRLL